MDKCSADALISSLTGAQGWRRDKPRGRTGPLKPSFLADDIDGAFNFVDDECLTDIPSHYGMPQTLSNIVTSFGQHRSLCFAFDSDLEPTAPFSSGLPQRYLHSPNLFVYTPAHSTAPRPPTPYSSRRPMSTM